MMVVRPFPNAGWGKNIKSENGHNKIREPGMSQDRMMLMIMVNDKHSHHEESGY
jgi:hypothetical protein